MKNITTTLCAALLTLSSTQAFSQEAKVEATEEKKAEVKFDREIVVTCNDTMQFDTKAIDVKADETVKITLKNVGKAPKIAMGHNLVILKAGSNFMAFAAKAGTARETDYIPADPASKAMVLAHTKVLGPGETDSLIFKAPAAGSYEFLCSFPGHFALMKGVITVK
ncbi:azurin [Verrucomicrobiaceae bacterium 227]